jgi:hypothetical protein
MRVASVVWYFFFLITRNLNYYFFEIKRPDQVIDFVAVK